MNRVKLDLDSSSLEKKLLLPEFEKGDDISSLFPNKQHDEDNVPWKPVIPTPGFCVKCRTFEGDKVFLNVCHTNYVPAPEDISDEHLIEILESEEASGYRVPMSIGDLHVETDKSGNLCSVYDIAINTDFYHKILSNELFKTFLMTITMEAIIEKYSEKLDLKSQNPYVILKNRKMLGTLKTHRIQQRPVKKAPTPLIEEIADVSPINPFPLKKSNLRTLEVDNLRLEIHPTKRNPKEIIATVSSHAVASGELSVEVGEDRLVVSHPKKEQKLIDVFLPYNVDQNLSQAFFNVNTRELRVILPLESAGT